MTVIIYGSICYFSISVTHYTIEAKCIATMERATTILPNELIYYNNKVMPHKN